MGNPCPLPEKGPIMRHLGIVCLAGFVVLLPCLRSIHADAAKKGDKKVLDVLNFKMKTLDGKEVDLSKYEGKVLLIVNVASKCGYTPQYQGLEDLHEKFASKGLVVLGVPSNDFGAQEPGTSEDIKRFCKDKYGVKFDMLEKAAVKGDDKCSLYKYLTSKETNSKFAGPIRWNFTKFLISRHGEVVARYEPKIDPESDEVVRAIQTELDKKN